MQSTAAENIILKTNMQKPRKKKKQITREKISAAAAKLFFEKGYDDTSYTDIAKRAEVGYGTVYSHFPSKESMLLDHTYAVMQQQITALQNCDRATRTHLQHALYLIDMAWEMAMLLPPRLLSVYMAHRWTGSEQAYAVGNQKRDELLAIIGEQFSKAQALGQISKEIDVPLHLKIMDAAYVRAGQGGRFSKQENAAAKAEFDKQLAYLLRL